MIDPISEYPTLADQRAESAMREEEAREREFEELERVTWPLLDEALERTPRMVLFTEEQVVSGLAESGLVDGVDADDLLAVVQQWAATKLDTALCCDGRDCGCRGSSVRQLLVHELN